jgi:hypothetical protein
MAAFSFFVSGAIVNDFGSRPPDGPRAMSLIRPGSASGKFAR